MKLAQYKKSLPGPLREVTLLFLEKPDEILLAMKKRGFGQGKWNGVGGKPDKGESIEAAAVRETKEEIGVVPKNLRQVATLDFYFPLVPQDKDWNQRVIVFMAPEWEGEPTESDEMAPQWYAKTDLPFDDMWSDDRHWIPQVLAGKKVEAEFMFDDNQEIIDFSLKEV